MRRQREVWKFSFMICYLLISIHIVESANSTEKPSDAITPAEVLPKKTIIEQSSSSIPLKPSQAQVRNRRSNSVSDTEQFYDNYDRGSLKSAFKYNDQIIKKLLLRTQNPSTVSNARSNFFYNILKPRATRYNSWDDHSVMHFGKRSVDSEDDEKTEHSTDTSPEGDSVAFDKNDSFDELQNLKETFSDKMDRQSYNSLIEDTNMNDETENESPNKRSKDPWHSMMSFGKRSESPNNPDDLELDKRQDSWHSMMNFGKKSDPWHNMMSFGKKSDPWHNMMSFGKKSENDWDHSTLHFGKRDDPWHNMMSFGKRSEGFADHNTLHFGKKNEPWHSMMSFGKKSDDAWDHSTLHFGKRSDPWHNMMSFGKRSPNPWDHNTLHFGKRDDPWHNMMSFGKRLVHPFINENVNITNDDNAQYSKYNNFQKLKSPLVFRNISEDNPDDLKDIFVSKKDEPWHNTMSFGKKSEDSWDSHGMIHFGKRDEPWHNMMSFGKKSDDSWDSHGMIHFGKKDEPWHNMMSFGKKSDDTFDSHGMIHFGKREDPWHNMMSFGKRYNGPWDNHGMIHFGKRTEPWHNMMSFGKKSENLWEDHGMIHFGKREEPWHSMMSFGKKSVMSVDDSNKMRFDKTQDTENKMDFEKKSNDPWDNHEMIHFGKKEDPWHNMMSFGKKSEDLLNQKNNIQQTKPDTNGNKYEKSDITKENLQGLNPISDDSFVELSRKFAPWTEHNTMHFGKRSKVNVAVNPKGEQIQDHSEIRRKRSIDNWNNHHTMHFGKKSNVWNAQKIKDLVKVYPFYNENDEEMPTSSNEVTFDKRDPSWDTHNTLHFGKKSEPWDNHNTMHFGKKFSPMEDHSTLHFGKKDFPWQTHSNMHFGKRSSLISVKQNFRNKNYNPSESAKISNKELSIKTEENGDKTDPIMKRSVNSKQSVQQENDNLKASMKSDFSESLNKDNYLKSNIEKDEIRNEKDSSKQPLNNFTNEQKTNTETGQVTSSNMKDRGNFSGNKNFNLFNEKEQYSKRHLNSITELKDNERLLADKEQNKSRKMQKRSVMRNSNIINTEQSSDNAKRLYAYDSSSPDDMPETVLHFGKRSLLGDGQNLEESLEDPLTVSDFNRKPNKSWGGYYFMNFDKRVYPWESHSTMHFGKKSNEWDHGTLHFGKKFDPWESHNTMHFGKRIPFESHNTMHFGKKSDWDHNVMHFGKRNLDDQTEGIMNADLNDLDEDLLNMLYSLQDDKETIPTDPTKLAYIQNLAAETLDDENISPKDKFLILKEYLNLLRQETVDQNGGNGNGIYPSTNGKTLANLKNSQALNLYERLGSFVKDPIIPFNEDHEKYDKDLSLTDLDEGQSLKSFFKVKKGFFDRPENKRYWGPFQGPKSIVYPHAYFASQIRRSELPRGRMIGVRTAEKKEDPVNSFMHFGRR